jgi:hypothetical protein
LLDAFGCFEFFLGGEKIEVKRGDALYKLYRLYFNFVTGVLHPVRKAYEKCRLVSLGEAYS